MPLPPLAEVLSADRSGQTWQQSGQMRGTVEGVRNELAMALGKAGWALNQTIALGQAAARFRHLHLQQVQVYAPLRTFGATRPSLWRTCLVFSLALG